MKQYNDQELNTKIKEFLTEKLQKYPELATESKPVYTVIEPSIATRLTESFTWFKPLMAQ